MLPIKVMWYQATLSQYVSNKIIKLPRCLKQRTKVRVFLCYAQEIFSADKKIPLSEGKNEK